MRTEFVNPAAPVGAARWARPLGYAVAYAIAVVIGRATRLDGTQTALVWPAAGVGVLWLLGSWRSPRARAVDVVLLFAATVFGNVVTGAPLQLSTAFGAANTLQAMATCAVLVRCPQGSQGLAPMLSLAWLGFAMVAGTLVGAVVGPASVALVGGVPWPIDPAVWILRNGVSAFVLVAAALAFRASRAAEVPPAAGRREFAFFLLVAAAIDAAAFGATVDLPVAFLIVPVGVWAGIRYRVVCASIHNVVMWVVVTAFTLEGRGPFAAHSVEARVILAQAVVAVTAFLTIALAISREQERRLARSLRDAEAKAKQHARDLEAVGAVAHQLAAETDLDRARSAVCVAAARTADADLAMLFQPDHERDRLVCTATADPRGLSVELFVPLSGAPSGATVVFNSGEPFFVDRVEGHPAVSQRMVQLTGVTSVVWQPVLQEGKVIAVLVVGWNEHHEVLPTRLASMLELLAAEAAVAINRAGLIAQLDDVARTDPLTGAHNRRSLDERLAASIERATDRKPLSVLMLDLDHFKAYNDEHGHQQGDRLLRAAVAAWSTEVRSADTVARYGGEEFAVILPACALEAAARLADRLRLLTPLGQTASIGVAQWSGRESPEGLLARADAALYRAKHEGRNRVEVASGDPELRVASA